jgi:hypothetical protein
MVSESETRMNTRAQTKDLRRTYEGTYESAGSMLLDHSAASHHVAHVKVRHLSPRSCKAGLPPTSLTYKVFNA